jgi:hypothetical protein
VLAFVLQHLFEHAPTAVENGFCHSCLRQFGAAHIAYDDFLVRPHNMVTELMESVLAPASDLPMEALCLPPVSTPLQFCQASLRFSEESSTAEALAIAGHRNIFEAKIDPYSLFGRDRLLLLRLKVEAKPPVPDRILGKAACSPFNIV